MDTIGIFTGKQKEYNARALTLLYDNGPLTAWELTAKIRKVGRQSLHATLNKRLRNLEKKGYVRREERKWYLRFKGFLAVMVIRPKPKMWNPKWKEIYDNKARTIEQYAEPYLKKYGLKKENLHSAARRIGVSLDDFELWIEFSKKVKELMKNGVINFDVIKEETLFGIITMELMTLEEITKIWDTLPETKENKQKLSSPK